MTAILSKKQLKQCSLGCSNSVQASSPQQWLLECSDKTNSVLRKLDDGWPESAEEHVTLVLFPVSSGKYSSLCAVWWKRIQATGVWSQWSAVLTFPVSGSGVWNSASSNTLDSSSSQVPCDSSLAVIFLASSAVCGSNLDASVSFVKASRVAVSISSPTGPSVSGFLALPLIVFLSGGTEILSWKTEKQTFLSSVPSFFHFDWPVAWSTQWLFLFYLHQNPSLWSWFQWVCPFHQGSLAYLA